MKWLFGILGITAAGLLGYVAEPALRADLTGVRAGDKALAVDATAADATMPAPAGTPVPAPAVVTPAPEPELDLAALDGPAEPADDGLGPAEPEPEPEPEPAPEPVLADATPDPVMEDEPAAPAPSVDVVAVMQASIRAGEIKEFGEAQVQGWQAGEEETTDGTTYQTGLVAYTAETVFGVRTIQAKAYIKDGKVERWIWPNSGMEIK